MAIGRMFLVLLVTFSLTGSTPAQQAEVQPGRVGPPVCYAVTDLGDFYLNVYESLGLSPKGSVVGTTLRWGQPFQGFEYNKGIFKQLPTLGGGSADPRQINGRGQIIGQSQLSNGLWHAARWDHGRPIDLGTLGGGSSFAGSLNDRGDAAGNSAVLSLYDFHAAAWFKGKPVNLSLDGEIQSYANGINNQGQVTGITNYPDGTWHSFIWKDGARTELPRPSGDVFSSFINNAGTVCGGASFPEGYHAYTYDGTNFVDLDPTSQWWWSACSGLNDRGDAVGVFGGPLGNRGFLWRNAGEGMIDLNTTIPPNTRTSLFTAYNVNGAGQITAPGYVDGRLHGFLLTPMVCGVHCAAAPSNLIAWWPGDRNAKDIAGSNDGILLAGPGSLGTYKPGAVGMAFRVKDGGHVNVPDATSLNFTDAMTVDVWVQANSLLGGPSAVVKKSDFGQANGYAIEMAGSQMAFYVSLNNAGWQSAISMTKLVPDTWYHVAGTYDGSAIRIYVNGALEGENDVADTIAVSTNHLNIGRDPSNPADASRFWDGLIDEVQLFNRALAPSEILTIYQAGRKGVCKA